MPIEKLYEIYGSQLIQFEILQSQIAQTKKQIVDAINTQKVEPITE